MTRFLEIAFWTAGLAMLGAYAGVRTWSAYASDAGVDAMRQARTEYAAVASSDEHAPSNSIAVPAPKSLSTTPPDTSTWSLQRIADYRETLHSKALPEAVLRIPKLKLEVPVYEGTSEITLNRGAGRIEGTAPIDGRNGNLGLAAHRDGFFRSLKDIAVGDSLFLDTIAATRQYRVTSVDIVDPKNVNVLKQTDQATVTLVTCYPFYYVGSAPKRFIVRAQMETGTVASD